MSHLRIAAAGSLLTMVWGLNTDTGDTRDIARRHRNVREYKRMFNKEMASHDKSANAI